MQNAEGFFEHSDVLHFEFCILNYVEHK